MRKEIWLRNCNVTNEMLEQCVWCDDDSEMWEKCIQQQLEQRYWAND